MANNRPDEDFQDSSSRPLAGRPVVYGADRHSRGFYGMLLVGAALVLAIVIYVAGMLASPINKTANNPPVDELPSTTGQGGQSR